MKKVLSVLLMLAMLFVMLPIGVLAESAEALIVSDNAAFDALSAEIKAVMLPCLMEKIHAGVDADLLLDTFTYRAEVISCLDALEAYAAEHSEKRSAFETAQSAYWDCCARLMEAVLNGDAVDTVLNNPELYAYFGAELEQTLGYMEGNTSDDVADLWLYDLWDVYGDIRTAYLNLNDDIGSDYYTEEELKQATETLSASKNPKAALKEWKAEKKFSRYKQYRNAAASLLSAGINVIEKISALYGYDSLLQKSLAGSGYTENMVYSFLNTIQNHVYLTERAAEIWKNVNHLDAVTTYRDENPALSEEAFQEYFQGIMEAAAEPLGEEYLSEVRKIYEEGHIYTEWDTSSSISNHAVGNDIYVYLMNNLKIARTLAHEIGHAVNYRFSADSGCAVNYNNSISMEVASQVNEILFYRSMKNNAENNEERMQYLLNELANIEAIILWNSMLSDFELELHGWILNGVSVTADMLDELFRKKYAVYFPYFTMVKNEESEWIQRALELLDTADGYVYMCYPMAYSMACYFADGILSGDEEVLNQYMEFLRVSGSMPTDELFRKYGIDLNSENCMDAVFARYEALMDEIDALYDTMNAR